MNILYVCKSLPYSIQGGIQTHVWKLADYMIRRGHQVTILTAGRWGIGERRFIMEGKRIIELPYLPMRKQPVLPLFLEELSFNVAAKRWLSKNTNGEYDIIHLQGRSGFMFPKKYNSTPIVTTFHGLIKVENERGHTQGLQSSIIKQWAAIYEYNALKNSDAVIAISHELQEEIDDVFKNHATRVHIISNGVELQEDTASPIKLNDKTVLFVGRLSKIKGIFNLVKSVKYLRPDIQLVMIGDGDDRAELEKCITTEGVSSRVKLLGALPNDTTLRWIKSCDVLILPSFHETQGIVLLEANACGKPVVATKIGGVIEVIENGYNGILCETNEPHDLGAAVNQMFNNPQQMAIMGKNGREKIEKNYDWRIIAQFTESLYRETIKQFMSAQSHYYPKYQPITLS